MAQNLIPIKRYFAKISVKLIDAGIESITPEQETELIGEIFSAIVTEGNMSLVQSYFKQFLKQNDRFDLLFNVNNREGSNGQARFMNVRDLSLGQKVVAMLTFVLGYSEHSNDYRPLIIDQPEDNLDNQYIYRNLVKQLRDIKEKRQVIIATHNATIVTNAKADLVCEMQSDNVHGWIETMGYPSEERVKKKIINHLEGGIDSFVHKFEIYRNVISRQ
jgi:predicted ATP-dependent endonuclease of OLD family